MLFLGEMTTDSRKGAIRTCSNEIIGDVSTCVDSTTSQIVFLVDVARFKENTISLNLFDTGKKINLDFICITTERLSYADPGVIRVYDVIGYPI